MIKTVVSCLAVIVTAAAANAQSAASQADCDRACLKGLTDLYFDALAKHDPSLLPVTSATRFTENGQVLKLGEGFWKVAGTTTYRLELFDPEGSSAAVQAVVKDEGNLATFVVRIKVENRKLIEIETIVAHKVNASKVFAPENWVTPSSLFTRSIRAAEQDSRTELLAAANAYFDAMMTEGTGEYVRAPFFPDTERYENGVRTTNADLNGRYLPTAAAQFDEALFKGPQVRDLRLPVVDVEHGLVLSIFRFGPRPPARPGVPFVCAAFAITAGKIREIQEVLASMQGDSPSGWPAN